MNKNCLYGLLLFSLICCRHDRAGTEIVEGDYELNTTIHADAKIFFSGTKDSQKQVYLDIKEKEIQLILLEDGQTTLLKSKQGNIDYPCSVKILKNGNFFRFWTGDITEWIRGPLGDWKGIYEPYINEVYIDNNKDGRDEAFAVKKRKWLTQTEQTAVKYGHAASFYEQQTIPGAILEYKGKYYMYFIAGMKGEEEGASRRSIGLATSDNLIDWTVANQPLLTSETSKYDNLYINGAVITPDNKIAIMYSAQKFPEWQGFMLATADQPEGPFTVSEQNPVYKHFSHAHEFDLLDLKEEPIEYEGTLYRYLCFYAGFTPASETMSAGDKGYLLYTNDLIHWEYRKDNPIFEPETKDNWDAEHVRPRSLAKIGEYWYLWYEGCNVWTPPNGNQSWWCDVVGLARSKDLTHWEYHPRNPVFSGMGQDENICGHTWVGWPRMVIKNQVGYVFFCGSQNDKVSTTYRSIDLDKLTDWTSDYIN
jgi:predicted GH43/DUF377 family glycosyl hydrolase